MSSTPPTPERTALWALSAARKRAPLLTMLLRDLRRDDFVGTDREIFDALEESTKARLDPLAFQERMSDKARTRWLMGEGELLAVPDALTYRDWLADIRTGSENRQIEQSLKLALTRLAKGEKAQNIIADMSAEVSSARARGLRQSMTLMRDAVTEVRALMKQWKAGDENVETVPTGFADLDRVLGGLERGHVTTLGGAPGQGKTQAAIQIARNVALWAKGQKRDSVIVIFSAEMSTSRLVMRLASSSTGVSTRAIRERKATTEQEAAYDKALTMLADLPIVVDETPAPTTQEMLQKVAFEAMQHQDGIDLVIFDYIELAGDSEGGNEDARVGGIMRGLKTIAKTYHCAVMAISQLNRENLRRSTRIPELPDLRSSGNVEALSQAVVFVMRPAAFTSKDSEGCMTYETEAIKEMCRQFGENAALFKIAKNRDGATGLVVMRFNPGSTQFLENEDLAKKAETPTRHTGRDKVTTFADASHPRDGMLLGDLGKNRNGGGR